MPLTHLDLCSGLAAWTFAAHELGIETIGFCESDSRCSEFIKRAWPKIPNFGDIFKMRGIPCDIISAGFPCQPYSRAGRQRGNADDRAIWPQIFRIIKESQPRVFIGENVPGIRELALDGILDDLESANYETGTLDIPACAVDSPQLRHRYYIAAFRVDNADQRRRRENESLCSGRTPVALSVETGGGVGLADSAGPRRERANAECGSNGRGAEHSQSDLADGLRSGKQNGVSLRPRRSRSAGRPHEEHAGLHSSPWSDYVWLPCADGKVRRAPDCPVCMAPGIHDGLPQTLAKDSCQNLIHDAHRSILGALGNSQVPQVATELLKAICAALAC